MLIKMKADAQRHDINDEYTRNKGNPPKSVKTGTLPCTLICVIIRGHSLQLHLPLSRVFPWALSLSLSLSLFSFPLTNIVRCAMKITRGDLTIKHGALFHHQRNQLGGTESI